MLAHRRAEDALWSAAGATSGDAPGPLKWLVDILLPDIVQFLAKPQHNA